MAEPGIVPGEVLQSVAAVNTKSLGDAPAFYQNQAYANAGANQQAMNTLLMTLTGKVCEAIIATSPMEAGGAVATLGQLMKGLQLTPPASG